jgi:hypothetical protein
MPTLQDAAAAALQVQNACNLSGVVHDLDLILRDVIWPEARTRGFGTDCVAKHAITTLFLDKLCSLNGLVTDSNRVHLAYAECRAIAASKPEAQ